MSMSIFSDTRNENRLKVWNDFIIVERIKDSVENFYMTLELPLKGFFKRN